jgi:hypothetical protein
MNLSEPFIVEHTPNSGENLIDRPYRRFLVPIAQLPNGSFLIPDDRAISVLEFSTARLEAHNRTRAQRIGRALCLAGVPVFEERGRIRVYCPRLGARAVLEALQFHSGGLTLAAELLRNYAETGKLATLAKICGEVEYKLIRGDIVIEKRARYPLPEGASLL